MGFINLDEFLEEVNWAMPEREFFFERCSLRGSVRKIQVRKMQFGKKGLGNYSLEKYGLEKYVWKNTVWKIQFGKIQFGKNCLDKYSLVIANFQTKVQFSNRWPPPLPPPCPRHLLPFLRSHIRFQGSCVLFLDKIKLSFNVNIIIICQEAA